MGWGWVGKRKWRYYSKQCVVGGRGCVSFRSESGSQVSSEEGKPVQCFVSPFPSCSVLQEARGASTHGLPPGCCQYCAEKNSWRTRKKKKKTLTFSSNSVNFETPSDSCFKVSSIWIHLPSCCFSQGSRLESKFVSGSRYPRLEASQGLGPTSGGGLLWEPGVDLPQPFFKASPQRGSEDHKRPF